MTHGSFLVWAPPHRLCRVEPVALCAISTTLRAVPSRLRPFHAAPPPCQSVLVPRRAGVGPCWSRAALAPSRVDCAELHRTLCPRDVRRAVPHRAIPRWARCCSVPIRSELCRADLAAFRSGAGPSRPRSRTDPICAGLSRAVLRCLRAAPRWPRSGPCRAASRRDVPMTGRTAPCSAPLPSAPPPATAKKMESLLDKLLESRCRGGRRKTLTSHPKIPPNGTHLIGFKGVPEK
jgi:hypothetical protein